MFKIAYGAGHYLGTAGRRIPESLDPKQTREWELNDRVARHFDEAAKQYEGVELLRVDDPAGTQRILVEDRCTAANDWGADFCLSIHHNAYQGNPWNGGGVVAFSNPGSVKGQLFRDAIIMPLVLAWYILTELGSILENAVKLGAKVPKWLIKLLAAFEHLVDDAADKVTDVGVATDPVIENE